MKLSILFLSMLVSACGKYGVVTSDADRVGDVLPVVSGFSSNDRDNITQICNSIAVKESKLSEVVGASLYFNVSQKNCTGPEETAENIEVKIQTSGTGYALRRVDNLDFPFSNIETLSSAGVLASICPALSSITQNPEVVAGSNILQFSSLGIDPAFCSPSGEEVCLRVLTARSSDRVVHTKEWIKVLAKPLAANVSKTGLITDRRKVTRGFCAPDEVTIHRAQIK